MRRAVSEEDKSHRREAILGAAKRVFAEKGYTATTIGDIAKVAGLSYGSIYWYFDSKDELFHSLMDSEERALRTHIGEALAAITDEYAGQDLFRAAVRATFEFFEGDRAAVKLLFRDSNALGERFQRHLFGLYEGFIDDIEAAIVLAQERRQIAAGPPRMLAFSVAALVGQIALRRLTNDDGLEAEAVADFVASLILDGLRPR